MTGERPGRVRRYLRDYVAIEQAEAAGINATRAAQQFGRWERAMNTRGVRLYIQAKSPTEIAPDARSAYDADGEQMRKLLSFLYGEAGGPDRLFTDTRRIDELSTALATDEGRRILEDERDLDRAFEAAGGRKDYVLKSLARALTGIQRAESDFADYADDDDVSALLDDIDAALEQLRQGVIVAAEARQDGTEDFELEEDEDEDEDESS